LGGIRLKLLVITPFYRWFIKELVEAQSKYLEEIHVLVHYNPLTEISNYLPFGGYFDHLRLYTKREIVNMAGIPSKVRVHTIETIYFIPDGKNPKIGDKLLNLFNKYLSQRDIDFDIIHAHFTYPQGYVAVKLSKEFDVPVIITAHGHDIYEMPFRDDNWRNIVKWTLEQATHIITVSHRNEDIIVQKLEVNERKISVIPNGYDSDKFKPISKEKARKLLGLPQNKKIILDVGNLYPAKGHKYLIEAMRQVTSVREDVMLYIVGNGPLRDDIQKQVKKLNLYEKIKLVGGRPHDEIPLWMNAADIFVLPSLSEGNPTVMFEALGVGLPFVGTAVGGVPEIVTSEDYGLLCPPADPDCLAEKILKALEKEWDGEKIRKYAEQFTWEKVAEKILGVYHEVLKN